MHDGSSGRTSDTIADSHGWYSATLDGLAAPQGYALTAVSKATEFRGRAPTSSPSWSEASCALSSAGRSARRPARRAAAETRQDDEEETISERK